MGEEDRAADKGERTQRFKDDAEKLTAVKRGIPDAKEANPAVFNGIPENKRTAVLHISKEGGGL